MALNKQIATSWNLAGRYKPDGQQPNSTWIGKCKKNGKFDVLSYFYLKWICYSKVRWTIQIKNSFCNWDSSGIVGKGGESVCLREPELHWAVRSLKSRWDRTHLVRVWWSEPPRTTHGGIQRPRPWSSPRGIPSKPSPTHAQCLTVSIGANNQQQESNLIFRQIQISKSIQIHPQFFWLG